MMLDIIVTHYNEPYEVGRKFFEILAHQRGVNFNMFRVILVNDGEENRLPDEHFKDLPYKVRQINIKHQGVSAARNAGLALSNAKWVMWCDFDDTFTSIFSLRQIMSVLNTDDYDLLYAPFFIEYRVGNDIFVKLQGRNNVWVHGRVYRREWLNQQNLRFKEGLHYSEDSAFNCLCNELVDYRREGEIKSDFPIYLWSFRRESVTSDPANEERNLYGFIDRNTYVVEEIRRRGKNQIPFVARMFADAYYAFHQKKKFPAVERHFKGIAIQYLEEYKQNDIKTIKTVMDAAKKAFNAKDLDTHESIDEWLMRITKKKVTKNGD